MGTSQVRRSSREMERLEVLDEIMNITNISILTC